VQKSVKKGGDSKCRLGCFIGSVILYNNTRKEEGREYFNGNYKIFRFMSLNDTASPPQSCSLPTGLQYEINIVLLVNVGSIDNVVDSTFIVG